MSATSAVARAMPAPTQPDLTAVKTRQQGAWSSGDYAVVGTTLQIVGETLCEALDLRAGQKILDVAAGNGNVTLAAARRWCEVVSTDYVPALLERGRERAAAERLAIEFREADAEALPFPAPRASSHRRSGAPARASPNCSARRPPRSSSSNASSRFATARRRTGSTCSRPIMARC